MRKQEKGPEEEKGKERGAWQAASKFDEIAELETVIRNQYTVAKRPFAVENVDGLATAVASPAAMFIHLSIGCSPEIAAALRMRASPSSVGGEAPEFLGDGVGASERLKEPVAL